MTKGSFTKDVAKVGGKPLIEKLKKGRQHKKDLLVKQQEKIAKCSEKVKNSLEECFVLLRKRNRVVLMGLHGCTSKVLNRLHCVTSEIGVMRDLLNECNYNAFVDCLMSDNMRMVNLKKCIRCMKGEDKANVEIFRRLFVHKWYKFIRICTMMINCMQSHEVLLAQINK